MRGFLKAIKRKLWRGSFLTAPLSIVFNPFYIIRNGLFQAISKASPKVVGDVLDFGCGSKPYESLFSKATSYIGVDIEVSGHNHQNSKIDFFYDGSTLPFPEQRFDAIVCFEVLEHVFNIDAVLAEMSRVLKPGGKLLVSVPFAWDEHEIPFDFARYTSFGLRHVLERNGFGVLESIKTTSYVLAVCQMFIAYLQQHVLPKGPVAGRLSQLAVVFPMTVVALILGAVLPKRDTYFSNCVVLAEKLEALSPREQQT